MRFSRPMTTSKFRRPMSPSRHTTFAPMAASAVAMLAVVVVLPTPPLPEVMVITFPFIEDPSGDYPLKLARSPRPRGRFGPPRGRGGRAFELSLGFAFGVGTPALGDDLAVLDPRRFRFGFALPRGGGGDVIRNSQLRRR